MLDEALSGRRLLDHPFYQRWQAGELDGSELARYAEQYRHIEAELPSALAAIAEALPADDARALVEANLADECGRPTAHVELFEGFARAAGARPAVAATPATTRLVEAYRSAAASSPSAGLGVVVAYEAQAAAIASSKGEGLRASYGYDASGTEFWDLHASLEQDHANWTLEALESLAGDGAAGDGAAGDGAAGDGAAGDGATVVAAAMAAGASAWWEWLSEREAEHAAA
jgi:pyrroloquinoline-quinone synthase